MIIPKADEKVKESRKFVEKYKELNKKTVHVIATKDPKAKAVFYKRAVTDENASKIQDLYSKNTKTSVGGKRAEKRAEMHRQEICDVLGSVGVAATDKILNMDIEKVYSDIVIPWIAERFKEGVTRKELFQKTNFSAYRVKKLMKEFSSRYPEINIKKVKYSETHPPIAREKVRSLLECGYRCSYISEQLNISRSAVYAHINKLKNLLGAQWAEKVEKAMAKRDNSPFPPVKNEPKERRPKKRSIMKKGRVMAED